MIFLNYFSYIRQLLIFSIPFELFLRLFVSYPSSGLRRHTLLIFFPPNISTSYQCFRTRKCVFVFPCLQATRTKTITTILFYKIINIVFFSYLLGILEVGVVVQFLFFCVFMLFTSSMASLNSLRRCKILLLTSID